MHRFALLAALVAALVAAVPGSAAPPPPGSTWTEAYFPASDGTKLHADILRDSSVPLDADHPQPVILTVSPYVAHSAPAGTDFDPTDAGPSNRWYDFLNGAQPLQHGYTYVMVDLPGFGGSGGCTDWGGPNEQGAVKSAVQWAASQPWSTGRVGMYGKSYDGWTGLMGLAQRPAGLDAVVAQEPVYDGYRYEYMNGIRISGTWNGESVTFDTMDASPGTTSDTTDYQTNSLQTTPWCLATNAAGQMGSDDPQSAFWSQRNLVDAVRGVTTPLLMTQGFLEDNTKPDAAWDFFNNVAGPKRGWFGQWDHVRGNEVCAAGATGQCAGLAAGRLKMGRAGWFDEVMRFYDRYLKLEQPAVEDPPIAVQDGAGRWRSEDAWPPADSHGYATALKPGSYTDDGNNNGTGSGAGTGSWTISPPLPYDVHFAGVPHLTVDAQTTLPDANLVADVYDIGTDGKAILISRGGYLLRSGGQHAFDLYGNDWPIPAGHRIGVLLTGSNAEWFDHIPTNQTVTIASARITLPFLTFQRTAFLAGSPSIKLLDYRKKAPFAVPAATISAAETPFALPDPLEPTG